ESGCAARSSLLPLHRPCRVDGHYCDANRLALRFPFAKARDTTLTLALTRASWRVGCFLTCDLCHQWIQAVALFTGTVSGPRQVDRDLRSVSSVCASLARNTRGFCCISRSTSCHLHHFSICGLCVSCTAARSEFLCCDASRTHNLGVANQFCRNWTSGKSFADHAERPLRRAGSKSYPNRVAEFSHYFGLLPSRRSGLSVLQTEWCRSTREIACDGTGSGDS